MSLSTVIQGLLVAQAPEYEISNEAIGYLNDFSGKVMQQILNEIRRSCSNNVISNAEIKSAIEKVFPQPWVPLIFKGATQMNSSEDDDKELTLKSELSDFEIIDDDRYVPEAKEKNLGNLFLSPDFIKSYLPSDVASRVDTQGCIYLAASLESVLSTLIQQARVELDQSPEPTVITKSAIEQAIQCDSLLLLLNPFLADEPEPDVYSGDFEPIDSSTEIDNSEPPKEMTPAEETVEKEEDQLEMPSISEKMVDDVSFEESNITQEDSEEIDANIDANVDTNVDTNVNVDANVNANVDVNIDTNVKVDANIDANIDDADQHISLKKSVDADEEHQVPDVMPNEFYAPALVEYDAEQEFELQECSDLSKISQPVFDLYGNCCPYFDITTFAIHMLSSIVELFMRRVISEASHAARPQSRALKRHVREVVLRLTSFQSGLMDGIPHCEPNSFSECVNDAVKIVAKESEWDQDALIYVSDIVAYVGHRVLLLAASQARIQGSWIINSSALVVASSLVLPTLSKPITKFVNSVSTAGEGTVLTPPPAPRIRAAEMIYLSSILKETPLQFDNQLLVVFMFLVSLSLHTLAHAVVL